MKKERDSLYLAIFCTSIYLIIYSFVFLVIRNEVRQPNIFYYILIFLFYVIIPLLIFLWAKTSDSRPKLAGSYSSKELADYRQKNELLNDLENENIKILRASYTISNQEEGLYIRCINKRKKIFFTAYGYKRPIIKIWTILQKEFNSKFSYNSLFFLFHENELFDNITVRLQQEYYE